MTIVWCICKSSPAWPANYVTTKHSWQLIWISKMVHFQIKSRFACELCDYKTFLAANLNRHVKAVHLRIKAYSCHLCDHKASTSQTLRIHMNNKHNVDPITHDCGLFGLQLQQGWLLLTLVTTLIWSSYSTQCVTSGSSSSHAPHHQGRSKILQL